MSNREETPGGPRRLSRRAGVAGLAGLGLVGLGTGLGVAQEGSAPAAATQGETGRADGQPVPGPGGADGGEAIRAPDPTGESAQRWEDVLLLEAIRYLRITSTQLQRIAPLARAADNHMSRPREAERQALASLARIAEENRRSLLAGRGPLPQAQQSWLRQRDSVRQRRSQAEEEVVASVLPKLARILTREQIRRAYLLALGEPAPERDVAPGPALLDPEAGFVLGRTAYAQVRGGAVRAALAGGNFPPHLIDALSASGMGGPVVFHASGADGHAVEDTFVFVKPGPGGTGVGDTGGAARVVGKILVRPGPGEKPEGVPLEAPDPQAFREAFERVRAVDERYRNLPQLILEGATELELLLSLRPLVRRMFLSPRLKPVMDERTARLAGS